MHQEPEHEDYDDDQYNYYPQYNDYGYPKYFDIDWAAWESWLKDAIKDIVETDDNTWVIKPLPKYKETKKFPVSSSLSKDASKSVYFAYLGSNYHNEQVWKAKYLVKQTIQVAYNNHIASHASYFLKQPNYYKGMFDILN